MPGFAYGIPAWKCLLGQILAKQADTVCSSCYALKGMYVFPVVKAAQERRLEAISKPEWVSWMVELIGKKYRKATGNGRVFRWHDSGDLQNVEHLSKIVEIAKQLPTIQFWLPTRERKIVRRGRERISMPRVHARERVQKLPSMLGCGNSFRQLPRPLGKK
jgi:hypothetical protein